MTPTRMLAILVLASAVDDPSPRRWLGCTSGERHYSCVGGERDVVDATRRTRLANERTYLAWLRSALTGLAVAVGAGKIVPSVANVARWPFELLGAGYAALALVFVAAGLRRFVRVEQSLEAGRF